MEKTATLNLRVHPALKEQAEHILSRLGIPMSTAINMYLSQIALTGGIPFKIALPEAPDALNADLMTEEEIHSALRDGYEEIGRGRIKDAKEAFQDFRMRHA